MLEHVAKPLDMLREIRRVLVKQDGVLFLAVPNARSLPSMLFGPTWTAHEVPRHLQFFEHRNILRLARDLGFCPVGVFPRSFVWPRPYFSNVTRLLRFRRLIRLAVIRASLATVLYPLLCISGLWLNVSRLTAGRRASKAAVWIASSLVYLFRNCQESRRD